MATRRRRHRSKAADPELEEAALRADDAENQLDAAKGEHRRQRRLREQERESVLGRLDSLAEENHLSALVLDVITRGGA